MTRLEPPCAEPAAVAPPAISRLSARAGLVVGTHAAVDVYSAIVPPILGVLEVRCDLATWQTASLVSIGSVSSGLSQPLAAWLSDRLDSRLFGPAGLALAAVFICSIGHAESYAALVAIFIVGMVGVGIFHPVGASIMGQLSEHLRPGARSLGLSTFFVAGMAGGIGGAMLSPWIVREGGFEALQMVMVPGLLFAVALHLAVRAVPHRHHEHHHVLHRPAREMVERWVMVGILYVSNAMRFTVNMALLYLYLRWAQQRYAGEHPGATMAQIADGAAPLHGRLIACMMLGMAIGGLGAGALVRTGRERGPLALVPLLLAPAVLAFPHAADPLAPVLAVVGGVGFAAMIPVTMGVGQRLLPHRTSLASGLMLGGAWAVALVGPILAERCLQAFGFTLEQTFAATAALLATSGLVCIALRPRVLAAAA